MQEIPSKACPYSHSNLNFYLANNVFLFQKHNSKNYSSAIMVSCQYIMWI